ncbi:MAG: hypothetical protein J5J00_05485, partial [Deltaproteobacteria bacterium]|nr:hypothetical protein [Deltaproteobacteria bacterium]
MVFIIMTLRAQHLAALLLSLLATLAVFNGVLDGKIISNCAHMYQFEPWYHHRGELVEGEVSNTLLSDSIDGADANLIAEYFLGTFPAMSLKYLFVFWTMMFFFYLYLREIRINWPIAVAVSMGLAFSSSNMLYYGWAHETQAAVIVLYFLERLTRTGKWA